MKLKVCGLTRSEDLLLASQLGFDFAGFIFYRGSPRYISPEAVKSLPRSLPEPERVGVFVDSTASEIRRVTAECSLDIVQLHGDESRGFCDSLGVRWWKAIRFRSEEEVSQLAPFEGETVLVEPYAPNLHGGSGRRLDFGLLERILEEASGREIKLVLAGGLGVDSLKEVEGYPLWGLDFNSGLEHSPGRKDPARMRMVIELAKRKEAGIE